jgi:hypothetical protein
MTDEPNQRPPSRRQDKTRSTPRPKPERVDPASPHSLADEQRRRYKRKKELKARGIRSAIRSGALPTDEDLLPAPATPYSGPHDGPDPSRPSGYQPPARDAPAPYNCISKVFLDRPQVGQQKRLFTIHVGIPEDADPDAKRTYHFRTEPKAVEAREALIRDLGKQDPVLWIETLPRGERALDGPYSSSERWRHR